MLNNPFTAPSEPEVFAYGLSTTIGDTVTIGGIEYLIVHNDTTNKHLYLAKKYHDSAENTIFTTRAVYNGSTIHEKCKTYYNEKIPESIKPLLVTLDCGYGCPVFIPTRQQIGGTTDSGRDDNVAGVWSYFINISTRIFRNESGTAQSWWLQSQHPSNFAFVCYIYTTGYVLNGNPSNTLGFRPCFAIKYNSLS